MKRSIAGLILGALLHPLLAQATSTPTTHEFTLDNGLKVIVHENHRAAVVHSQLWYKVGASYEGPGQSGLSHALEHMVFSGSSKLCSGESYKILERLGGTENAATGSDFTYFHQTVPPQYLAVALETMADQMSTAHLSPASWAIELEIIKNERSETVDNQPSERADEMIRRVAFPASASGSPIIGWQHDLDRMRIEALQHWYRSWYAPNNATLIIAGDIHVEQAKALATRYFGPIARRELPITNPPIELPTPGERSITQHLNQQSPKLSMKFNVPSLNTQSDPSSAPALQLLSQLLGGSASSLLKRQLLRGDELVSSVDAYYSGINRGDELFSIDATPTLADNASLSLIQRRIWDAIDSLKNAPPSVEALERARRRLMAHHVFKLDNLESHAFYLAELEIAGLSWKHDHQRFETMQTITPQDIQRAAKTFLTYDRLTTGYVLAQESRDE